MCWQGGAEKKSLCLTPPDELGHSSKVCGKGKDRCLIVSSVVCLRQQGWEA